MRKPFVVLFVVGADAECVGALDSFAGVDFGADATDAGCFAVGLTTGVATGEVIGVFARACDAAADCLLSCGRAGNGFFTIAVAIFGFTADFTEFLADGFTGFCIVLAAITTAFFTTAFFFGVDTDLAATFVLTFIGFFADTALTGAFFTMAFALPFGARIALDAGFEIDFFTSAFLLAIIGLATALFLTAAFTVSDFFGADFLATATGFAAARVGFDALFLATTGFLATGFLPGFATGCLAETDCLAATGFFAP
jgi:hypothetical protein